MDITNILIAVGLLHCSLFFFDLIFRSCSLYPYHVFLEYTGLEIKTFSIAWFTTSYNRLLIRWGKYKSKFLTLWFNTGVIVTMCLLPVASFLLLRMLLINVIQTRKPESNEWVLEPLVPGVNVPFADIQYYIITLILCSIFHEFGHALAASRENLQVHGIGFLLLFIIPVAYVSLNTEQLGQLSTIKQLRILCAGLWHNVVLALISALLFSSTLQLFSPFYHVKSGIIVKSMHTNSPLIGSTGLKIHDEINRVNECTVKDSNDWYHCILETIKQPTPGYCVDQLVIQDFLKSGPVELKLENDTGKCCSLDNEEKGHLCFEVVEEPLMLPGKLCLPARRIVEESYCQCQLSSECSKQNTFCVRPALDNKTKVVRIKRNSGKDVLFIGDPGDIYKTTDVSEWLPKYYFLSPVVPEFLTDLFKYITVLSAGQAIINVIPCFWFDGQYITTIIVHKLLKYKINYLGKGDLISFIITCIGTFTLFVNILYAFLK